MAVESHFDKCLIEEDKASWQAATYWDYIMNFAYRACCGEIHADSDDVRHPVVPYKERKEGKKGKEEGRKED